MRKFFSLFIFSFLFAGAALASEPTEKDAIAMTEKAEAFLKANSKEKLIAQVNTKDPQFFQGELYLIVLDLAGNHLAHPTNSKLIGKSM